MHAVQVSYGHAEQIIQICQWSIQTGGKIQMYMYGSIGMKGFMNKTILYYTSYNSSPNQFFSSYGK